MQPQPYFPEAETVNASVATESYDVRLGFVRRVAYFHCLTQVAVGVLGYILATRFPDTLMAARTEFFVVVALLLLSSFFRKIGDGPDRVSAILIPFVLVATARFGAALHLVGIDLWTIPVGIVLATLYVIFAGRDFSFVAQFVLAGIGSILVGVLLLTVGGWSAAKATLSSLSAIIALAYTVYDHAALLQRRRLGQEVLAALDLYRDCFNFVSYTFRVIHHWRNFRI